MLEAQKVLGDCRVALDMLDEEEEEDRWRIIWAGAITLLRSVGHILLRESETNPGLKVRVGAVFREHHENKQAHRIYWNFIKAERDSLIKENVTQVHESSRVVLVAEELHGHLLKTSEFLLEGNLFRPLQDGVWAGEDARDVYKEAIEWWEAQITKIYQMPQE